MGYQLIPEDGFGRNPGRCIVIVKKSFLDNSKKTIFNNLEDISFQYVGKIPFDNYEKIFKNKSFSFPKSINYNSVKQIFIFNNPPVKLSSLDFLENLEKLCFHNYCLMFRKVVISAVLIKHGYAWTERVITHRATDVCQYKS